MIELDTACRTISFDAAGLLERVGGDTELLREIVEMFTAESPHYLAELRRGCAEGNADILKRTAHTLKGAASNFGAAAVVMAARDLEMMGREGNLAKASAGCERLEEALRTFEAEITQFVATL